MRYSGIGAYLSLFNFFDFLSVFPSDLDIIYVLVNSINYSANPQTFFRSNIFVITPMTYALINPASNPIFNFAYEINTLAASVRRHHRATLKRLFKRLRIDAQKCIFSNGQAYQYKTLVITWTDRYLLINTDFFANKLWVVLDQPKIFRHLIQFFHRYIGAVPEGVLTYEIKIRK